MVSMKQLLSRFAKVFKTPDIDNRVTVAAPSRVRMPKKAKKVARIAQARPSANQVRELSSRQLKQERESIGHVLSGMSQCRDSVTMIR
jgi:hypothetical protein